MNNQTPADVSIGKFDILGGFAVSDFSVSRGRRGVKLRARGVRAREASRG